MKKILALLVAVLLIAASMSVAFADPVTGSITVDGLATGDTIKYYQVIQWDETDGWELTTNFESLDNSIFKEVVGNSTTSGKITDASAIAIAALAGTADGTGSVTSGTSWTQAGLAPGLYMVQAVPTTADVIYNPVFVAVQADGTAGTVTLPLPYDDNGTAKKSTVTLNKYTKSHGQPDTAWDEWTTEDVGDIVDYKIEATVPAYLENYTNPTFVITDVLTKGLTYKTDGANNTTLTISDTSGALTENTDYTYSFGTTTDGKETFTINLTKAYLQKHTAATALTVAYQAKITEDAKNVNPETNTATIEYSRNPDNANDHGTKEDKTTHYTFSIDAGLQGDANYTTSELVQVAVDEDGHPILEEVNSYSNHIPHHPLQGAEFKIFTNAECTTSYTNSTITADTVFTSNEMGLLNISGLDEGTYYLKETKAAPGGYMLLTERLKFVIEAEYKDVPATETCNAYKELKSYTVKTYTSKDDYGTAITSSYTIDNGTVTKNSSGVAGDNPREIENTKGVSLPSTGGIGTTIFYVGGGILVLAAIILLVTKRRMNAND